jgi:ABC-type nitrate/sulfonate/bicarbonate transport system, permease component
MNSNTRAAARAGVSTAEANEAAGERTSTWYQALAKLNIAGQYALSLGFAVVTWGVVVAVFDVPSYIVPSPIDVAKLIVTDWNRQLWGATLVTSRESLAGFFLAVLVSVPLAMLISYSKVISRLFYPLMVMSQVVPKVAIAPLFIIWFGFGEGPKVLVAFLTCFFVIVVSTTVGLKNIEPEMIDLARSMGASTRSVFFRVRLPNALPSLFGSLKVAVTFAIVGAVVGELVGSSKGLGYLVMVSMGQLNTTLVFASIVLMSILGMVMLSAVELAERFLIPWQMASRQSDR